MTRTPSLNVQTRKRYSSQLLKELLAGVYLQDKFFTINKAATVQESWAKQANSQKAAVFDRTARPWKQKLGVRKTKITVKVFVKER